MGAWRWITADGVDAAAGLACDEVLARSTAEQERAPTLRLYTYRPHCALIGRFQDQANEIDLEYCAANGIAVNRRPTGGGAILMGPDQLGVALAMNGRGDNMAGRPRELMRRFADGLVRGLRGLGIEAGFRGKNDLEVSGRKIAGLGIYRDPSGGLLFHGSLLVDLDVALMSRVLRTPFKRITDRELAIVARRTTTVRERSDADTTMSRVRESVGGGFEAAFGVELIPSELDADEIAATGSLCAGKYESGDWLTPKAEVRDADGRAVLSTPEGTLEVRVAMAGARIKAVYVRGDFFADHEVISDLEWRLRWHSSSTAAIRESVRDWSTAHGDVGLPAESLGDAIVAAVADGLAQDEHVPYGCFVDPDGGVA